MSVVISKCVNPVDLGFVLDTSDNIGSEESWILMKSFITDLIGGFDISRDNTKVGVVTYSDSVEIPKTFNDCIDSWGTTSRLNWQSKVGSATLAVAALNEAYTKLFYPSQCCRHVPKVLVFIYGGKTNGNHSL